MLPSCVRSVECLRKQRTEVPSANMQSDDHVSSVKSDLLKSCGTFNVLVGVTGSVAALKLPVLVSQLLQLPGVSSCVFIFRTRARKRANFILIVRHFPCSAKFAQNSVVMKM